MEHLQVFSPLSDNRLDMKSTRSMLSIYAGPTAYGEIQENGIRPQLFNTVIGASGGPKWFVLYGLDRYLYGEFFKSRCAPLNLIGSSAGGWRLSCLAQSDPVSAIERLGHYYSRERYSARPGVEEVTEKAQILIKNVLGNSGAAQIAANSVFRLRLFADRSKWLTSSENRVLLTAGLALCALTNGVSRESPGWFFDRVVFYGGLTQSEVTKLEGLTDLPTHHVRLHEANVLKALLATGAIPLALGGVRNIESAPRGIYRDGGIMDYHFNIPFHHGKALVLYPHFYSHIIPGWFDKVLPWRFHGKGYRAFPANYHNVLLLCPSREFVRSLPFGKIPDRGDFANMDYDTRFDYWQTVMDRSQELADEFKELVNQGNINEKVQPFHVAG